VLKPEQIEQAAEALYKAERERVQIKALSLQYPDVDIDDAYAIQRAWVGRKIAEGRSVIGHKIGLTSRAMQTALKVDEPDYGTLLDDMLYEDGGEIEAAKFLDPRIEVELAFVLKDPLAGDKVSVFDVLNATDYVIPAMELIAARCYRVDPDSGYTRTVRDTISDNAGNGGLIIGGQPIKPMSRDLRWCGALLYRSGVIEETGIAAGVLNHPANGVAWLARKFAPHDIALEAGQIILAGSFTRPVPARAGDVFHCDFGELGGISCRFV
jgi:2-oxo-hept-3-ene-1,7-dioate hydratase